MPGKYPLVVTTTLCAMPLGLSQQALQALEAAQHIDLIW